MRSTNEQKKKTGRWIAQPCGSECENVRENLYNWNFVMRWNNIETKKTKWMREEQRKIKKNRNKTESSYDVTANLFTLQQHIFVFGETFKTILCAKVNVSVNRNETQTAPYLIFSLTRYVFFCSNSKKFSLVYKRRWKKSQRSNMGLRSFDFYFTLVCKNFTNITGIYFP